MQFASKRQILEAGLLAAGIEPMPSQGGFFLMGKLPILREYRDLPSDISAMDEPYDWKYLRYLVRKHSVVGIPASPFFSRNDYDVHYNNLRPFVFNPTQVNPLDVAQQNEQEFVVDGI